MKQNKNLLLTRLAQHYENRDQPFTLSSGISSHEYLDCRAALSSSTALKWAAQAILDKLDPEVEAVGGLTMGADPLAIAVAIQGGKHWFSVRKEAKQHGAGRQIEGFCHKGARVAVLEDVSTTGTSALKAVGACWTAGMHVQQVLPLVDRGGVERLLQDLRGPTLPEVQAILSFEDVSLVGRARQIALKAHGDQKYGELPYSHHLEWTVRVIAEMCPYDPRLLAAAWLHDTFEATDLTQDQLEREPGMRGFICLTVDACTDGPGANRKARKERPYQLIPQRTDAVVVKVADRTGNAEAARQEGKMDLVAMYRREHSEFRERLRNAPVSPRINMAAMWVRLEEALG